MINEQFYLYSSTGKKMTRKLLEVYDDFVEADEKFELLVQASLDKGFFFLDSGSSIEINGFSDSLLAVISKTPDEARQEPEKEHRKLSLC